MGGKWWKWEPPAFLAAPCAHRSTAAARHPLVPCCQVKSMQMFRQPVQKATQGDRLGLCVTQLDAKTLERGIACSVGHVVLISHCLISVRQIRFFKAVCKTKSKV